MKQRRPTAPDSRRSTPWALARRAVLGAAPLLALLLAGPAAAQVAVNQILFPVNIGRTLDATVSIDFTRTSAAAAVIRTPIPAQLGVDPPAPPAGCVVEAGPVIACTVPAGAAGSSGTLSFPVRGTNLGSFSLVATATGGSSASNTGTVHSSGDLTVLKSKAPAGNLLNGQSTTFTLRPQLAAGADSLPAGASITVTDQLPGTATDFRVSAINGGIASCNSVASADSSRTVSCTLAGPLTVAAINAATITITGAPGTTGTFSNVASVAAGSTQYLDRDPDNNTATVGYTVDAGGDVQALAAFPPSAVLGGSAQTLTLSWRNNGPLPLPAGGSVQTTLPAGFTLVALPAGCSGPATGVALVAPAVLNCITAAAAVGATQSFAVPLLMPPTPAAPSSGSFTVTAAPPAGFGDAVPANNSVNLPWAVVEPFADLNLAKAKSPASGPVAPGSSITTTLTVGNAATSPSPAVYSAAGGATPLRVVDYLRPEEIAGDTVSNVSPGWTCTVSLNPDPVLPARSRRVLCLRDAAGSLAPGASLAVSFRTTVAPLVGQVTLANRACTGETLLADLVLPPSAGPQPPGSGQTGNDCATAGTSLIATDVVGGQAAVTLRKESSVDGITWVDPVAGAPTLAGAAPAQFWRITITTPAGGGQAPIPTLVLSDSLPGILNVASPGAPAPAYVTPAVTVNTAVNAGSAGGACPNLAAGTATLSCSFSNVAPGTTLVVSYSVQRPFASGTLTNTATLSSPDALLSGTLSDAAALVVEPRIDVATTTKTVTPATPRIGQAIQFTITTQNLGPDSVAAAGDFKLTDDLNTSVAGAAVAFGDITASGAAMACAVATSALPDEAALPAGHVRVRCINTAPVARYATRTVTIGARVLKPAALPAGGTVYSGQSNTARVDIPDGRCEFKTETSSNASVSAACNDGASTSNNTRSVSFDVLVPQIDVQQRKTAVRPAGQSNFAVGQPLRYRFRLQNNGPSRAEGVSMSDRLTVPAGFTLTAPRVLNVNAVPAEGGYTLDNTKAASLSCSQAAPNADVVCTLAPLPAASFLDAGREVNFEVELTQAGNALGPVAFGNEALVCADEASAGFESAGACNRVTLNNNNVAAVNDVVFPRTDLTIAKTTFTPQPVGLNQPVEFRLVAQNRGPSPLQQLRITDVLPPGFELVTSGAEAPSFTLGPFVTRAPSTATGATLACTAVPSSLSLAGEQQTVSCRIDATPGPLGAGAFPGQGDSTNTVTLRLFARPLAGLFNGPWRRDLANTASIAPGLDGGGDPLSINGDLRNVSSTSQVQVDRSSLGGRVFLDRNGNGAQDGTDTGEDEGLGGVTVTLLGADAFGNPVARTTTTLSAAGAARGEFRFDDLPPGTYTLTQTQPGGYLNSPGAPVVPATGGSYRAAATVSTSQWSGIVLPLGTAAGPYLFPETRPGAIVSGHVFSDRNGNGALDVADAGLAGVSLGLYPAGTVCPAAGALPGGALQTTLSDSVGRYAFTGVTVGSAVVICQQQPAGHADRPPQPGTAAASPRANQIDIAVVPVGGSVDNDFPEVLGQLSGLVFFDHDPAAPGSGNNGVRDGAEPPIGSPTPGRGVPITLTGTPAVGPGAGVAITPRSLTTGADGSWRFDDLLPGTYTVTQGAIPPALGLFLDGINTAGPVSAGTPGTAGAVGDNAIRDIVLAAAGAAGSDNRFAKLPRTAISGLVFVDADRDRALTAADTQRLPGVVIELRQGGTTCADATLLGSTTTAADGRWVFPGGSVSDAQVVAGQSYRVCERQPAGWTSSITLPGNAATTAVPDELLIGTLPVAGSANNFFGEVPTAAAPEPAVISGTVFVDRNRDGLLTAADPGRLAGVVLRLVDGSSCSGTELARTTTDSAGRYRLPATAGRSYSVCQEQPAGYGDGPTRPGNDAGTPAANHITLAALPAGGSADNDFGEWGARITGRVYLDRDDNGRVDATDVGIPGVVVTLDGPGGTRATLSGADGRFAFEDLPAGSWTLTEQAEPPQVDLDGSSRLTTDGRSTPGTGGGTATPVGTLPSRIAGIALPLAGQALDNLFGEGLATVLPGPGGPPELWVSKQAIDAPFMAGGIGRYRISVRNAGGAPSVGSYTVSDRLPAGLSLAAVPSGEGWACSAAVGGVRFSCSSSAVIAPGAVSAATLDVEVQVGEAAAVASPVSNAVLVEGGGEPAERAPGSDERDRFERQPELLPVCAATPQHNACRAPTAVVRPAAPSLVVGKTAQEPRFLVGRSGHYRIEVRNSGSGPTSAAFSVSDRLPAGLSLAGTPVGNGWSCSGVAGASRFSCSRSTVLPAGASAPLIEVAVQVADSAAAASTVSNAVLVEGGGEAAERAPTADERDRFDNRPESLPACTQPPTHNACRAPVAVQRTAALSGTVWLDGGRDRRQLDDEDRRLGGWQVELVDPATGRVFATTLTGPDGRYRFSDLEPGVALELRFRDPSSGIVHVNPVNGERGTPAAPCNPAAAPSSCTGPGNDALLRVLLAPGQELTQQSLPVRPTGSVYDSATREPLPAAVVSLAPVGSCPAWDPATQVAAAQLGGYVIDGGSIRMRTGTGGYYQFLLLPTAPARCRFELTVEPPPGLRFPSDTIPAQPQPLQPAGPAGTVVLVQPQLTPPSGDVGPATAYHLLLDLGSGTPVVENNHLPLDPAAAAGLLLGKTGDRAVVEIGDTVRYSISVRLASGSAPRQVTVVDRLPAGFSYVPGTAMVGGRRIADPAGGAGPRLAFQLGPMPAAGSLTLQYRVRVGVGAAQGDGLNRATAFGCNLATGCVQQAGFEPLPAARASNEGLFRVRVAGGVFGIEACLLGKVFVDCNGNHVQDPEEPGIPGVRMVLQDGSFLTSDSEGKVSMCGLPPRSHVLRVDEQTLPRGARLTTSSNRNLGDAGSLWLDLHSGGLQRADFIEGSCSNTVLDQVKARRAQGEPGAAQVEKAGRPALRFDSKAHGRNVLTTPQQGTDSANQLAPRPRAPSATGGAARDERNIPAPRLPMNQPPPDGRRSSDAPDAPATADQEAGHGTR